MTVQTSQLAVSLDVSAIPIAQKRWKSSLQIATTHDYFDLVNDWPHPFAMLMYVELPRPQLAPGVYWLESLVYPRLLNGTGVYSEPASIRANTVSKACFGRSLHWWSHKTIMNSHNLIIILTHLEDMMLNLLTKWGELKTKHKKVMPIKVKNSKFCSLSLEHCTCKHPFSRNIVQSQLFHSR